MHSRIRVVDDGNITTIEIPAVDHRLFSAGFFSASLACLIVFLTLLRQTTLLSLPMVLIFEVSSLIFALRGLSNWQWSSRGMEVFKASPRLFVYEREGAIFDRKKMRVEHDDIKIQVLLFGIGGNRIEMSTGRRKLYCGRDLSREDAFQIRELLLRYNEGWRTS